MQYRIFLIEDDPVIARTVRDYLERLGYAVACGQNFADLAPEFAAFDPQLVLLDLSLPYRNGYHWCRVFRELSPGAHRIFVLGGGQPEHRHRHGPGRRRLHRQAL